MLNSIKNSKFFRGVLTFTHHCMYMLNMVTCLSLEVTSRAAVRKILAIYGANEPKGGSER